MVMNRLTVDPPVLQAVDCAAVVVLAKHQPKAAVIVPVHIERFRSRNPIYVYR